MIEDTELYETGAKPLNLVAEILDLYGNLKQYTYQMQIDNANALKYINMRKEESANIGKNIKIIENLAKTDELRAILEEYKTFRTTFIANVEKYETMIQMGDIEGARNFLNGEYGQNINQYNSIIKKFRNSLEKNAKNISDSNTAEANAVARKNIILAVIISILSIVFAYVLTKYITGMVGKLTEVSQKVAKGEVNVNVEVESSDEFGKLAQAMQDLVGSIKGIIEDAKKFYNEQKLGEIDYFIDVKKYNGAYREVANSINEAANLHIQNILKILNILGKYAEGDFSQQLEKLPGKQIVANQAMDKLRENLANMLLILNEMSKKVEQNDLNFRIDASEVRRRV
jgi:methyl-accepting chemotaxis protein